MIDHEPAAAVAPASTGRPVRRGLPGGVVVALVALVTVVDAWTWRWFVHPDLGIARRAAGVLFSGDWYRTYVEVPRAQMGPLSIAVSRLPHDVYVVLVAAMVLPFLALAAVPLTGGRRDRLWLAASWGLVVPWAQFAWKGHADDALVLVCAALVVHALDRGARPRVVLGLWAVALLAKPTAVVFAPLVVSSVETLALAAALFVLLWLPFVWDSPTRFLDAAKGVMQVSPHSLWGETGGLDGPPPIWLRPVQLGASVAVAAWAVARRAPAVALLLAFTVRSMAEMNPAPSYAASVVALALLADARSRRLPVLFSIPALAAFWSSQQALDGSSGWPRILAHLTVIALCLWSLRPGGDAPRRGTDGSAGAGPPRAELALRAARARYASASASARATGHAPSEVLPTTVQVVPVPGSWCERNEIPAS